MLKTIKEVFKSNLRRLRGDRTQADMASLAGIPFPSYRAFEYGRIPQGENLAALAAALGVSETALFLDPDLVREPTPEQALEVIRRLVEASKQKL